MVMGFTEFYMNPKRSLLVIITVFIVFATLLSVLAYNQSSEMYTLTNKKSELEVERADLIGKVSTLEKELVETTAEVAVIESRLKDMDSANLQLKDDIERRDGMISALEKEMADAMTRISNLSGTIQEHLEQIRELTLPMDQRHLNSSLLAQQVCAQCHGPVVAQAGRGESNKYHNAMLINRLLNFECTDCHKSVDIFSRSENLTRVVDVETCKKCHTAFPEKIWMITSPPEDFARSFPDCVDCHDWRVEMADAMNVNLDIITEEDCTTCHLDNALFPTEKKTVTIPCKTCHPEGPPV
jgi:chaperonin cofactor prefoldin